MEDEEGQKEGDGVREAREGGRRMCEQQRCISVQRSIHRVEVNARPYSGRREEREGGRIGESREKGGAPWSRGRDGRAEGIQARSGKK